MSLSNEKIYKHSWCVRVRWNPLEHNPSRPVENRRNPFRLTRLNPSKHVTTCRKHVQTCWNTFPVDPMNFLFYIFLFLYFYIFYFIPPPSSSSSIPPNCTGGEPPPPPAGRPSEGGGTKSPPLLPQTKNKIYKSNDICTLENNIL